MKGIKVVVIFVFAIVVAGGILYYNKSMQAKQGSVQTAGAGIATANAAPVTTSAPAGSAASVKAIQVWDLPAELLEISANELVDADRMACVQDNDGIIFIYNLQKKSIENKIEFAGKGDYEGLTRVNKIFYVLRSDGMLYEVNADGKNKPTVTTYDLPFSTKNDVESLFYDEKNKRLLIGVKEQDLSGGDGKGVYSFDLGTKKLNTSPVLMLAANGNENSDADNDKGDKKKKKDKKEGGKKKNKGAIKPSDMVFHPKTGELLILNGPKSELLIADSDGTIKSTIDLDKEIFPQPEGICFSSSGELYISSEGTKRGKGVIAKVQLQ